MPAGSACLSIRWPQRPPTCPRVTATAQTSNGTVAVIEEKDNCLAQPDVDTIGGADVATGRSRQEGVPPGKLT